MAERILTFPAGTPRVTKVTKAGNTPEQVVGRFLWAVFKLFAVLFIQGLELIFLLAAFRAFMEHHLDRHDLLDWLGVIGSWFVIQASVRWSAFNLMREAVKKEML